MKYERITVGSLIVDFKDRELGNVTHIHEEDGRTCVVINDDFEVTISRCEEVIDCVKGKHYFRID